MVCVKDVLENIRTDLDWWDTIEEVEDDWEFEAPEEIQVIVIDS